MDTYRPRVAVVVFPGSNCEQDVVYALRQEGADADLVWHGDDSLEGADAVILPGGFAHGDYLRTGAIARFSPIMDEVRRLSQTGRPVLGICNGFQILAEAGLVAGALHRNVGLRFICAMADLIVHDVETPFTCLSEPGQVIRIPVNHYEGNYAADPDRSPRVVMRYQQNRNGSWRSVAGVANDGGTTVGMMPHPERAMEEWMGTTDGRLVFASLIAWCGQAVRMGV